jgi:hypothetical protein
MSWLNCCHVKAPNQSMVRSNRTLGSVDEGHARRRSLINRPFVLLLSAITASRLVCELPGGDKRAVSVVNHESGR